MGWANCGEDSKGRPIGYAHEAECDEPGCTAEIDRGLSYACGDWHGDGNLHGDGPGCENYFCPEHLYFVCVAEKGPCNSEHNSTVVCRWCLEDWDGCNGEEELSALVKQQIHEAP